MALWQIYVDGASRGQGSARSRGLGHGAVGVVVCRNHKIVWQFARGLGRATNSQAEYEAVLCGVLAAWSADEIVDPIIYSDSELVVKQVNGVWKCKNAALFPYWYSISLIAEQFRFRLELVPRSHVVTADRMANDFLDALEARLPATTALDSLPVPRPIKGS